MPTYQEMSQSLGGRDPLDAPTPGESLTSNPEARMPYEKPPAHTNVEEAVEDLFFRVTEEENLDEVLDLMRMKVPVEDVAQVVLFEGFRQGQWNPDLMLMMIEPTIYMLLALGEYAGIDVVLYPEESMDEDSESIFGAAVKQGPEEVVGDTPSVSTPVGQAVEGMDRPASVSDSLMTKIQQAGEGLQNG